MKYLLMISLLIVSISAHAEFSFGGYFSSTGATQNDINAIRNAANTREGGIGATPLENGLEFAGFVEYRFPKSMMAFQFRPSYFFQSTSGDDHEYGTSGPIVALLFRTYPLEGDYMRMFLQFGLNYGFLYTDIREKTFSVDASGSNLGIQVGGGLQLTFGAHLITFEAGFRYLNIERNIVDSTSGTPETATGSVDAVAVNGELERSSKDVGTNLTGLQMMVGYGYRYGLK